MLTKSKFSALAIAALILALAATAIHFRSSMRCAGFAGPGVTVEELPPAPRSGNLRLVAWNVRNFPLDERPQTEMLGFSRRTNICDLETTLSGLGADIFAFSEITDTRRFPPILSRTMYPRLFAIEFSKGGGRWGQHLAIAWDEEKFDIVGDPIEITDVMLDPNLRPALAVELKSRRPDGFDLLAISVHFAASPQGFDSRRRQYRALAAWIDQWIADGGETDVVALGDFNTTGPPGGNLVDELAVADRILGSAGLRRIPNATGCSEYWEGHGERDGVQVPGLLDQVYLRGFEELDTSVDLESWLHCQRHRCAELVSYEGAEDGTFWDVSDHCPLSFEVADVDRDD